MQGAIDNYLFIASESLENHEYQPKLSNSGHSAWQVVCFNTELSLQLTTQGYGSSTKPTQSRHNWCRSLDKLYT